MTDAPTPLSPPDDDRAQFSRQIALLGELADLAVRVAREIERQAISPAEGEVRLDAEAAARALGRITRAVRLTILLQTRLMEARQRGQVAQSAANPDIEARKADVQRIVGRAIGRAVEWNRSSTRAEMERQTCERLDRDFGGDILARPLSELIAMICKDIGLDPQWPRLAQEAWAHDEVAGGEVGWPLADFRPALAAGSRISDDPPDPDGEPDDASDGETDADDGEEARAGLVDASLQN